MIDDLERLDDLKPFQKYANSFPIYKTREEEFAITSEYYNLRMFIIPLAWKANLPLPLLNYLVLRKTYLENDIVSRNLRLCLKAARSQTYVDRGLSAYDRLIAAIEGLIYSTRNKFNPYFTKNGTRIKFSTYTTRWIHQRIGKAIAKYGSAVKIAGHVQDQISKIRMVVREYMADPNNQGDRPNADKISVMIQNKYKTSDGKPLYISPEEVAELGRLRWKHLSLDETPEDGAGPMVDCLSAPDNYQPEEVATKCEMREKVMELVSRLDTNESLLISYKFGLLDSIERSNKQIAALLKIPQKEFAALEASAMANFRKILPADFIEFLRD